MIPAIGATRPWTDPRVTSIARLPMRVPSGRPERRSLDGDWAFALFDHPDDVPESAVTGPAPDHRVAVPGNWSLQDTGHPTGDRPHYTNVRMPFPGPPPRLPDRNPTGVYRRTFTVPASWRRRQVIVHVGGADSVHAVFVNAAFVGYGTDSRLASEYDATPHLVAGRNEIAIVVIRYSAMSYVEDQDQWWMAGLHRSVLLEARPRVHVDDVRIDTGLDLDTGTGTVTATAVVGFADPPTAGWRIRSTLTDPGGRRIGRPHLADVDHRHDAAYRFTGHHVVAHWIVPRCRPWSAERPDRYRVTVELLDHRDRVVDAVTQQCGIRRVDIAERSLLVNGRPVWIFGVNRHDHHPDRGAALTVDDVRADLVAMRAHNITAIRTSHYPNDPVLSELCDELGMYVICEANLESHAYNTSLCDDDRYRSTFLERVARMVERDRNHPCVIAWSLGNESGYGAHHDAAAAWVRRVDPSRPLHYEGAIFHGPEPATEPDGANGNWIRGGLDATDLVCPMYPTIESIRRYGVDGLGTRPLIMCEYSHAMGNSNGSLADTWDVIESTPGLQGGFVWEWKDHGLRQRMPDGTVRLAHGGDFGDHPNDGNFVADGLMSADLEPHPAMRELAWVYRPVTVAVRGSGASRRLVVSNRRSFTGIDDLAGEWDLLVGDRFAATGSFGGVEVGPHGSTTVPLPCAVPSGRDEVHLTVRWRQRRDTWFARAGHLVAWDQVLLRSRRRPPTRTRSTTHDGVAVDVAPLLTRPVELSLWRAATDNDGFKLLPELSERLGIGGSALARWTSIGFHDRTAEQLVDHVHEVRAHPDGSQTHRHEVVVPDHLADLPRVGVRFGLPERFTVLRWFGRGPHENYPDRNRSAMVGVWTAPVDLPPYHVPQEFGLRTEVRWWEAVDPVTGDVVRVDVLEPSTLAIGAVRFTAEDLFAAAHAVEVTPRPELVVHLDVAHRGLGTASCGPDVADTHRIPAGAYRFNYRLSGARGIEVSPR